MTAPRRVLLFLANGYILVFFSELAFWGSYDPVGMAPAQFLLTWLAYSVLAHILLAVVEQFQVSTIWSVFLAGSVYGWMVEGVLGQTLYGTPEFPFPITVSWTGLAWHALISVLVGWFLARRTLRENAWRKMTRLACLIGGYRVATRTTAPVLRPDRLERWSFALLDIAYFGVVTLPQQPTAGSVLPPSWRSPTSRGGGPSSTSSRRWADVSPSRTTLACSSFPPPRSLDMAPRSLRAGSCR